MPADYDIHDEEQSSSGEVDVAALIAQAASRPVAVMGQPTQPGAVRMPPRPQPQPVSRASHRLPTTLEAIDLRLRLASYYRVVLDTPLFEDMSDPLAQQVQAEVAHFVTERMGLLTGVSAPKADEDFTPEERAALKALAARILSEDGATEPRETSASPQSAVSAPPPSPPLGPVAARPRPAPVNAPAPRVQQPTVVGPPRPRTVAQPARIERTAQATAKRGKGKKQPSKRAATVPVEDPNIPKPLAMPRGGAMTAVMEAKALEALAEPSMVVSETIVKTR